MLGVVLRLPAPIPPLPGRRLSPAPTMASSLHNAGAGVNKPDPAPAPAPEPPEKPLPGDCCGSGCVRCVWDVYYDELDAYNKALAAHSSSGSDGKAPAESKPSDDVKSS
ncbi:UPF0651 protein YPL107W, mitochondrial-like [Phragmites australis]|uniref:UPF0651 protein YPL107W, mitochondrial-like n=1 Tax=Phragmites australis TaxID=29695 RepID=UPI002D767739|nr:UPF0651 protein YPL107W, mitochondrial-like [Phragmites australis]